MNSARPKPVDSDTNTAAGGIACAAGAWRNRVRTSACKIAFVFALVFASVITPAGAGEGPPTPDPMDFIDLLRKTVRAVDSGNKSGDYSELHAMGSTRFQAEHPKTKLASEFASLRATKIDLAPFSEKVPITTRPPRLDLNGLLRIMGLFQVDNTRLIYDVVYEYDAPGSQWRLAGVKLDPRELPPQPKLMQPE